MKNREIKYNLELKGSKNTMLQIILAYEGCCVNMGMPIEAFIELYAPVFFIDLGEKNA
jgi:hypothetical protein